MQVSQRMSFLSWLFIYIYRGDYFQAKLYRLGLKIKFLECKNVEINVYVNLYTLVLSAS